VLAGGDGFLDAGLADVSRVFSTSASAFSLRSRSTAISSTLRRAGTAGSASALHAAPTKEKVLLLQRMPDFDIGDSVGYWWPCGVCLVQVSATVFTGRQGI